MAAESKRRVAVVSPEPTPYRAPLFDAIAERPEIDLTVIYAAETVAGRTWTVEPRHRAVYLRGAGVPGARRILHHDYPVTPGILRALSRRPSGLRRSFRAGARSRRRLRSRGAAFGTFRTS